MKIFPFTLGFLLLGFQGYSQKNKPQLDLSQIRTKPISLKLPEKKAPNSRPIKELILLDARTDTTSLGFYTAPSGRPYSLITEKNISDEISEFLGDYLGIHQSGETSDQTILMVLRKLWISPQLQQNQDMGQPVNSTAPGGVITKIDFYEGKDNQYRPLYRFDTTYSGLKNISRQAADYLGKVLMMSVEHLLVYPLSGKTEGAVLSIAEIGAFSRKTSDNPINHTHSYKKGVYLSYEEFKANNPSIENYTITKDRLTQTIFLKDDKGGEYPQRDLWGYCDGNKLYIKSGDNYFELKKKQRTFISLASRPLQAKRSVKTEDVLLFGPVWGSVGPQHKKVSYNLKLRIYELDMETGELY